MRTRLKVCRIASEAEARIAIGLGPTRSGVRTNGALNPEKLAALISAMASADA